MTSIHIPVHNHGSLQHFPFQPQYKIADPICTFIFSVLVIFTTVPILKDLANVLMEGAPQGVDYALVASNLTALPGVKMVHSLHVWALTLDKNACSVHLAIGECCGSLYLSLLALWCFRVWWMNFIAYV